MTEEGFDDVKVDGPGGGNADSNRLDIMILTVEARNSRGKAKVYNK